MSRCHISDACAVLILVLSQAAGAQQYSFRHYGGADGLQNAIWQFPFRNLAEIISKMNRYSSLGAQKLAGKRVSMGSALGHGIWAFLKHYVMKRGYRDGLRCHGRRQQPGQHGLGR